MRYIQLETHLISNPWILELHRLRISFLLLGRLCLFYGVVSLWHRISFSKRTILHFPWRQTFFWEMWTYLYQNTALMGKVKLMKTSMRQLEMQLQENFSMFFCIVAEKKSAVLELFGYYHWQCFVAITQPSNKCFQTFRLPIFSFF